MGGFWRLPEYCGRLPEFFIKLLTDRDDIVLDPFAGSGMVAEKLGRQWIAMEMEEDCLKAGKFRFEDGG